MGDERVVGQHGAVAHAAGAHHQIIFLVVALAVDFIESAKLSQDFPADQKAEADGCRDVTERRQAGGVLRVDSQRRRAAAAIKPVPQRQRGDGGVIRTRVDEAVHDVQPQHARHFRQRAGRDLRVRVQHEKIHAARHCFGHSAVHRLDKAEIGGVRLHAYGRHFGRCGHAGQDVLKRRVVRRIIVEDDVRIDGGHVRRAASQAAGQRLHKMLVAEEWDGNQHAPVPPLCGPNRSWKFRQSSWPGRLVSRRIRNGFG